VANSTGRRTGTGGLILLGAAAILALGLLVAWLLVHRTHPHTGTTIIVTTGPATSAPAG